MNDLRLVGERFWESMIIGLTMLIPIPTMFTFIPPALYHGKLLLLLLVLLGVAFGAVDVDCNAFSVVVCFVKADDASCATDALETVDGDEVIGYQNAFR
jgi:hypothetical protein